MCGYVKGTDRGVNITLTGNDDKAYVEATGG